MKCLKLFFMLFALSFYVNCTSDSESTNLETNSNSEKIQSTVIANLQLEKQVLEAKAIVENLEHNVGGKLMGENLSIGTIEQNKLIFKSQEIETLVKAYFRLVALKSGNDSYFEDFNYLSAKNNEGFDMLISSSYKIDSDESVNVGIDLTINKSDVVLKINGSQVVCVGCRRGCNPRRDSDGDGYCTDCEISNSNCTKSETGG